MIIIDTSIWIEFFRNHDPHFEQVSDLLSRNEVLALSPVFGELLQGARDNAERTIIQGFWKSLPKPNEDELLLRAGIESSRGKWMSKGVGLIDSAIICAARETASFIWTLDKNLLQLLRKEEKYTPPKI